MPGIMLGRDQPIADLREALEVGPTSPFAATLLIGTRGIGKTALLNLSAQMAEEAGWETACVSCGPGTLNMAVLPQNEKPLITDKRVSFLQRAWR